MTGEAIRRRIDRRVAGVATFEEVDRTVVQRAASLRPPARRRTTALWREHVHPRLAGEAGEDASPDAIRDDLERAGIEEAVIGETMELVDAIRGEGGRRPLLAEDLDWVAGHPGFDSVRRLRPLGAVTVERLRRALGRRGATLVAAIAYAGLRPGEALALTWDDVHEDSLAIASGPRGGVRSRAGAADRRLVRLLPPLAEDLAAWREVSSHPGRDDLVFPHRTRGAWTDDDWRRWRKGRFAAAVGTARLPADLRPFDLRHTFALLLIDAGVPLTEIAREMGHGPMVAVSLYRHLGDRADRIHRPAEVAIRQARAGRQSTTTGTTAGRASERRSGASSSGSLTRM